MNHLQRFETWAEVVRCRSLTEELANRRLGKLGGPTYIAVAKVF